MYSLIEGDHYVLLKRKRTLYIHSYREVIMHSLIDGCHNVFPSIFQYYLPFVSLITWTLHT